MSMVSHGHDGASFDCDFNFNFDFDCDCDCCFLSTVNAFMNNAFVHGAGGICPILVAGLGLVATVATPHVALAVPLSTWLSAHSRSGSEGGGGERGEGGRGCNLCWFLHWPRFFAQRRCKSRLDQCALRFCDSKEIGSAHMASKAAVILSGLRLPCTLSFQPQSDSKSTAKSKSESLSQSQFKPCPWFHMATMALPSTATLTSTSTLTATATAASFLL